MAYPSGRTDTVRDYCHPCLYPDCQAMELSGIHHHFSGMRPVCMEPDEGEQAGGKDAAGADSGGDHPGGGENPAGKTGVGADPCAGRAAGKTDPIRQPQGTA